MQAVYSTRIDRTQIRNRDLKRRFDELYATPVVGKLRPSIESIVEQLCDEFYLSEFSVRQILRAKN